MDNVLSLAKVLGARLDSCRRAYRDLQHSMLLLGRTVTNVEKLCEDRNKEVRLRGAIQESLLNQLEELSGLLDEIDASRTTCCGKISLFCGSCCGKGAQGYNNELQRADQMLKDTLMIANSEAMVVTASATEELAGGAAGRHIQHQGARSFWREQYKNELALSKERFEAGMAKDAKAMQAYYQTNYPNLLNCLMGRLDTNYDGLVSVREFANFCEHASYNLRDNADLFEIVREASYDGALKGAVTLGHTETISAIAAHARYIATGDEQGYVKIWLQSPAGILTLVTSTTVGSVNCRVNYLCFFMREGKLMLAAAVECIVEIDVFTGKASAFIRTPHTTKITSITGEENFLFSTAEFPYRMCAIWKLKNNAASLANSEKYEAWGKIGDGIVQFSYLQPVGDLEHVACMQKERAVLVWNYHDLTLKVVLNTNNLKVSHVRGDSGTIWVGYCDEEFEDGFTVEAPDPVERRPLLLYGYHYPLTHVSNNVSTSISRSRRVIAVDRVLGTKNKFSIPVCMKAERCFSTDYGSIVLGNIGSAPAMAFFNFIDNVDGRVIPVFSMTNGTWTMPKAPEDMMLEWAHSKHTTLPIVNPENSSEICFFCAGKGNYIYIFDESMRCVFRHSLRFSTRPIKESITAVAFTENYSSVVIGTSEGKLVRFSMEEEPPVPQKEGDTSAPPFNSVAVSYEVELRYFKEEMLNYLSTMYDVVPNVTFLDSLRKKYENLRRPVKSMAKLLGDELALINAAAINRDTISRLKELTETIRNVDGRYCRRETPPESQFSARFRYAENWGKCVASDRLYDGKGFCGGCRKALRGIEVVWQLCIECGNRREHPNLCLHCKIEHVPPNSLLCRECYKHQKAMIEVTVTGIAIVGNLCLVGGLGAKERKKGYSLLQQGIVLLVELPSLVSKSKLKQYAVGLNNVVGHSKVCKGIFAVTIGPRTVGIFNGETMDRLQTGLIKTVDVDGIMQSLCIAPREQRSYEGPENYPGWLVMGANNGSVTIVSLSVIGQGATKAVSAVKSFEIEAGVGSVYSVCSNNRFLCVGGNNGTFASIDLMKMEKYSQGGQDSSNPGVVRVLPELIASQSKSDFGQASRSSLFDEDPIVGKFEGHNGPITSLFFFGFSIFTSAFDGTLARWPLDLMSRHKQSSKYMALLTNVFPSDTFHRRGMRMMVVGKGWEWRAMKSAHDWHSLSSAHELLQLLFTEAMMDGILPAVSITWKETCLSGTLFLDKEQYRRELKCRLTLELQHCESREVYAASPVYGLLVEKDEEAKTSESGPKHPRARRLVSAVSVDQPAELHFSGLLTAIKEALSDSSTPEFATSTLFSSSPAAAVAQDEEGITGLNRRRSSRQRRGSRPPQNIAYVELVLRIQLTSFSKGTLIRATSENTVLTEDIQTEPSNRQTYIPLGHFTDRSLDTLSEKIQLHAYKDAPNKDSARTPPHFTFHVSKISHSEEDENIPTIFVCRR